MNAQQIYRILSTKCKDTFLGVYPIDRLPQRLPPRRPLLLVCNTEPHDKPGEHWIVMYIDARQGEYFDSYGEMPQRRFKIYMEKFCWSWLPNDKKLQSIISFYCGHYCIFYCLYKTLGYDMKSITDCFVDDTANLVFMCLIAHLINTTNNNNNNNGRTIVLKF